MKPIFLLMYCSYKLIKQTRAVKWADMPFEPGMIERLHNDGLAKDNVEEYYDQPPPTDSRFERVGFLLGKLWYHLF